MHEDPRADDGRKFIRCEDNGEHYDFVALSIDDAKRMLYTSGAETIAEADAAYGAERVEWREMSLEEAQACFCTDEHGKRLPLSEWPLGMWFGSMYP